LGSLNSLATLISLHLASVDVGHGREVAVMIQERVPLDSGLDGTELGPGEQGQVQVDDRRAKAEQVVFKRETGPIGLR
jgi:hypothetical protein